MKRPFQYGCVVTGNAFCPRPALQTKLARDIRDGQNTFLVGERRTGKTSLIFATAAALPDCRMLYVDLLNIRTPADFCNRLATAASRLKSATSLSDRILAFLSRLRPTFSLDPENGMPVISVDSRLAEDPQSLADVLSIIEKASAAAPLFVVFDEFQDIRKLPAADQALALLRARIQLLADTAFVFSGSVRTDIADLFANPASPFFKSARTLTVGPVPDDDFAPFLARRFALGHRTATRPLLDEVFEFTHRIPGDVQQLCAALWNVSEPGDTLSADHLKSALREIYEQESGIFELQTSRLTRYQFKALVAVAKAGGQNVYSADFLARAELPTAAAATRAFQALVRDGILYLAGKEYRFFNPFLRAWILGKNW